MNSSYFPLVLFQTSGPISIVCPSFVSDCLETLEEINIRARAQWLELGGRSFSFIPCLNTHPAWVEVLVKMIKREAFED
jgi:ferrochelatase